MLNDFFLIAIGSADLWYALPLIVAVSLVYAATRHEAAMPIITHAARVAFWMTSFFALFFLASLAIAWSL